MSANEPNRTYVILTALKLVEAGIGSYATQLIVTRYMYGGPLNVMYITLPTFVLISLMVFIQRIVFRKTRKEATVFEAFVCGTGFLCYLIQVCVLMYLLPRADYVAEDEEGETTKVSLARFRRTINFAITTTVTACIYLLDGFISGDAILTRNSIPLWFLQEYPNPQVDLQPLLPLVTVFPWESRLAGESIVKRLKSIHVAKNEDKK